MKSVLLSIKPELCALIASGEKTVEIRKNRPKIDVPFKCYIYCTLNGTNEIPMEEYFAGKWHKKKGKVIGEFVCDNIQWNSASDLWIAEDAEVTLKGTCSTKADIYKYLGVKSGTSRNDKKYEFYCWHISDLVIYDKPKELSEFCKPCADEYSYCEGCRYGHIKYLEWVETAEGLEGISYDMYCLNRVQRPPQSWCYVEEFERLEK